MSNLFPFLKRLHLVTGISVKLDHPKNTVTKNLETFKRKLFTIIKYGWTIYYKYIYIYITLIIVVLLQPDR